MVKWISVKEELPREPEYDACDNCQEEVGCDDCKRLINEYLVTVPTFPDGKSYVFIASYHGNGVWENECCGIMSNVVAWAEKPEPYKDTTKYRWRFNPDGYGNLRQLYLTATFPILTLAEWDFPVEKKNYKNVFTEADVLALAKLWDFDVNLFVKEEIEDPIAGQYTVLDEVSKS